MTDIYPFGRDQGDEIISKLDGVISALADICSAINANNSGKNSIIVPETNIYLSASDLIWSDSGNVDFSNCVLPKDGDTCYVVINGDESKPIETSASIYNVETDKITEIGPVSIDGDAIENITIRITDDNEGNVKSLEVAREESGGYGTYALEVSIKVYM